MKFNREIRDWSDLRAHWAYHAAREPDYRRPEDVPHLKALHAEYEALKKHGWREIIYCPKDGTRFLAIEPGSTGVHVCYYMGEWPKGSWWIDSAGDTWPARPILFRPMEAPPEPRSDP